MYFCLLPHPKMLLPIETVRTQNRRGEGDGDREVPPGGAEGAERTCASHPL